MSFKKLALAAAVAAAPMGAFAMQPMNDAEMSSVTGQDGISITLGTANISTNVWIEDTDGFDGVTNGGFIVIPGLDLDLSGVNIAIDAGSSGATGGGVLQVAISVPTDITINNLAIHTAGSDAVGGEAADFARVDAATMSVDPVLSMGTVTLTATEILLQLGPEAGSPSVSGTDLLTFGAGAFDLEILDIQLYGGTVATGFIGADAINVNGIDLAGTTGNLTNDGLVLTLGASMNDLDVSLSRLTIGDAAAPALGNVYLTSLDISGTELIISGK